MDGGSTCRTLSRADFGLVSLAPSEFFLLRPRTGHYYKLRVTVEIPTTKKRKPLQMFVNPRKIILILCTVFNLRQIFTHQILTESIVFLFVNISDGTYRRWSL